MLDEGPAAATDLHEIAEMRTRGDGELVGMRADIITAIDGHSIKGMDDLITYLARHTRPGQDVTLTVHRDGGQVVEIPITVGESVGLTSLNPPIAMGGSCIVLAGA